MPTRSHSLLLVALLSVLPSLGACRERAAEGPVPTVTSPSPAPAPAPAPAPDPAAGAPAAPAPAAGAEATGCELITVEEAAAAAGVPMRVVSPPGTSGCALDSVPPNLTIEVIAVRRTGVFDELARRESSQPLPGIADGALFVPVRAGTMAQLVVASGDRMLLSTLHLQREGPDLKPIAEAVARAVAPRL